MTEPIDTVDRYPNISAEALRLVLATIDFDTDAFNATLGEDVCHTCALRELAQLAATWLIAAVGHDDYTSAKRTATRVVCDQLAVKLDKANKAGR